jgi:hypothetical protein
VAICGTHVSGTFRAWQGTAVFAVYSFASATIVLTDAVVPPPTSTSTM